MEGAVSYVEEVCNPLIDTLSRTTGIPTFQLAGHVPNLTFWMGEIRHAIGVIDGYAARFENLAAAQADYDLAFPDQVRLRRHHEHGYKPLRRAITSAQCATLHLKVIAVGHRLVDRCLKENLIRFDLADELRSMISPL
jgi:hypothetical protein